MAEVQKNTVSSGEMTLRFIEFVRMHTHNTGMLLGRVPHPQTGKPQVNLDLAKILIEQLMAIEAKTRGNLNSDEEAVLTSSLAGLQADFAKASGQKTT
jgi:hypothetical protein